MRSWRRLGRILGGLLWLTLGGTAAILLFHFIIMPLLVHHGQETQVPDVRGLPLREARSLLIGATLAAGRLGEEVDDHVPAGRILRQSPPPGLQVKRGRAVDLVISLGPEALCVPAVVGESLVHARFLLARGGIAVGRVQAVSSRLVARDEVVASSPPPETPLVGVGSADLLVSTGPPPARYVMPDVRGLEVPAVSAALEQAGLKVTRRVWRGARGRLNEIVEQTPPPGYPVAAGGTVELMTGD